ncbi:MAG: YggN family protein [Colwellia sp.]|nr:YggN family protein [Colwellia sp.]
MKTLIASALILASSSTFAYEASFSNDSCDADISGGIKITPSAIEFSKNKKQLYKIVNNETLFVDDEQVDLTYSQQSLVTEYSTSIRAVVPQVKNIALDAIDLASDGVNLAFNELLGDGNDVGAEITAQLAEIRVEVDQGFSSNKEIYFDEDGFSGDDFFSKDFEQRIESAVESTVQNSIGSLMIAVGQQMLFSGGDSDTFETRMENFGEKIEHEMEARGEQIEKRGEALCQSVVAIDALENQLANDVEELQGINLLTTSISAKTNKNLM